MSGSGRTACLSVDLSSFELSFDLDIDLRLPGSSSPLTRVDNPQSPGSINRETSSGEEESLPSSQAYFLSPYISTDLPTAAEMMRVPSTDATDGEGD